jgi:hypothetical protein
MLPQPWEVEMTLAITKEVARAAALAVELEMQVQRLCV